MRNEAYDMKGKKILITSGGCLEKWDEVRGHTNLAKGTIGRLLAEEALAEGAHVIYLHGYFAEKPNSHHSGLELHPFEGIIDLQEKMKSIITNETIDVVIMAAAGSDWIVDKMYDQDGKLLDECGKISSDIAPVIYFKKVPKILKQIKEWDSNLFLIGFKLESGVNTEELMERAKIRMNGVKADMMIANAADSLYTRAAMHYLIRKDEETRVCNGKDETAKAIIDVIKSAHVMNL